MRRFLRRGASVTIVVVTAVAGAGVARADGLLPENDPAAAETDTWYPEDRTLSAAPPAVAPATPLQPAHTAASLPVAAAAVGVPPAPPLNVVVTGEGRDWVAIQWSPSLGVSSGVSHYEVWRTDTSPITYPTLAIGYGPIPCCSAVIGGLPLRGTQLFYVRAQDYNGNFSPYSVPWRTRPPGAPVNPRIVAMTESTVTLAWDPATDDVATSHYDVVLRDNELTWTAYGPIGCCSATIGGLERGRAYKISVQARDFGDRISEESAKIAFRPWGESPQPCSQVTMSDVQSGLYDTLGQFDAACIPPEVGTYSAAVISARATLGIEDSAIDLTAAEEEQINNLVDSAALSTLESTTMPSIQELNAMIDDVNTPMMVRSMCAFSAEACLSFTMAAPQDQYQALNEEEKQVCRNEPYDCYRSRNSAPQAYEWTNRLYPGYAKHNDRADAFRHCMWSAMMTKSANAGFAKRYGDAHEYGDHGQPIPERRMDLHNNTWGRDTGYRYEGRTQRDTAYECRQLSYNGTLAIRPF